MSKKKVENEIYHKMDNVFNSSTSLLCNCITSEILQTFFFSIIKSLFYANLIQNFFNNLNQKNVKECNLSDEIIPIIKKSYCNVLREINLAIKLSLNDKTIDEKYYNTFKSDLKERFPEAIKILVEIEKGFDISSAKNYFNEKKKELRKIGKPPTDLEALLLTTSLEKYVKKGKKLPFTKEEYHELIKIGSVEISEEISLTLLSNMKKNLNMILKDERKYQRGFENRLYQRWKEPLDLLELFIRISMESGVDKKHKLPTNAEKKFDEKGSALIQIHARALQIANEIFTLVKYGYADGANARWRSLHELAVISFFLHESDNDVSTRFLEHDIVKKFEEAIEYKKHYKKLEEEPIGNDEFNLLKTASDKLLQKYGNDFKGDYGWIPKNILKAPTFKNLQEYVKLDKFRPYYKFSSNAIHGSSRGFYRLGLGREEQNKILLAGPTNYGLADPIQNTAISLLHVTVNFLTLRPDINSIILSSVLIKLSHEIGIKAVEVQKKIDEEERSKPKDGSISGFILR